MTNYANKIKEYLEEVFKEDKLLIITSINRNKVMLEVSNDKRSFTYMISYTENTTDFDTVMMNIANDIRSEI